MKDRSRKSIYSKLGDQEPNHALVESIANARPSIFIILIFIEIIIAFVASSYFYTGTIASDDVVYISASMEMKQLVAGSIDEVGEHAGVGAFRLGLVLPTALVIGLSDSSHFWPFFYFIIYHLLLVGLAAITGYVLHDTSTGLLAGLFVAVHPLIYRFSTTILPDNAVTFWFGLVALLLVVIIKNSESMRSRPILLGAVLILAGFLTGVAYSVKASGLIILVPACFAVALFSRKMFSLETVKNATLYLIGVALFIVLEVLFFKLLTHEIVFRLGMLQNPAGASVLLKKMAIQGIYPWERVGTVIDYIHRMFGPTLYIGLASTLVYVLIPRINRSMQKATLAFFIFFLWLFCYHSFGLMSFKRLIYPSIQPRYFAFVVFFLAVMSANVMSYLAEKLTFTRNERWRRVISSGLVGLVAVAILWWGYGQFIKWAPTAGQSYGSRYAKAYTYAFHDAKRLYPNLPIYITSYFQRRMELLNEMLGRDDGYQRLGIKRWPIKHYEMHYLPPRPTTEAEAGENSQSEEVVPLPDKPFILISDITRRNKHFDLAAYLAGLGYEVYGMGQENYYAAETRYRELMSNNYTMLNYLVSPASRGEAKASIIIRALLVLPKGYRLDDVRPQPKKLADPPLVQPPAEAAE